MLRQILIFLFMSGLAVGCSSTKTEPTPIPTLEGVTHINPVVQTEDITLIDQNGSAFQLSSLRDQVVVMAFGYTHCPDVCPITLARFKQVKAKLGDKSDQVRFVFVSVDGTRDTPERLNQYLGMFDDEFIGLTGEDAAVRAMIGEYGGEYAINNYGGLAENYTVDHTASNYVLNQDGEWCRTYAYGTSPDVIAADLTRLLEDL